MGILSGAFFGNVLAKYGGLKTPLLCMVVPLGLSVIFIAILKAPSAGEMETGYSYSQILRGGTEYFAAHGILIILTLDMVAIGSFTFLIIWSYQMLRKCLLQRDCPR